MQEIFLVIPAHDKAYAHCVFRRPIGQVHPHLDEPAIVFSAHAASHVRIGPNVFGEKCDPSSGDAPHDAIGEEGYLADLGLVPLDEQSMARVIDAANNLVAMKK